MGSAPCLIFECEHPNIKPPFKKKIKCACLDFHPEGSFHKEHCKGAWLASHDIVSSTPTHITLAKKNNFFVCVASLCHYFCLFHESLCFVVSLCSVIYSFYMCLYFFYLIHDVELYICYLHVHLYNRSGDFHLLLLISVRLRVKAS